MVSKQDTLFLSGEPRSIFYSKRGDALRGRKTPQMIVTQNGKLVDNPEAVETILQQEFCVLATKNV